MVFYLILIMIKSEPVVLAETFEMVRNLTMMYLNQLDKIDVHEMIDYKGIKFNSAYWIAGHLTWSEHSLIVNGVAGEDMGIDWIEEFAIGKDPENIVKKPSIEEILKTLEKVHSKSMEIIKNLSDKNLDEENHFGIAFGGVKSKRNLIKHLIRHEPMHIGQLSLILKVNGIKFA